MKKLSVIFLFLSISVIAFALITVMNKVDEKINELEVNLAAQNARLQSLEDYVNNLSPDSLFNKEWFLIKLALARVESNDNPNAVNPWTFASGIFQIMPIFIAEANRLQDSIVFTKDCVWDITLSNQMVEIITAHHNPKRTIAGLARTHNPTAGNWYKERIIKEYEYLKQLSFNL